MIDAKKLQCRPQNVVQFRTWLAGRGGLFVWQSVDLGDPGQRWTTPARDAEGRPTGKPYWKAGDTPVRHITDPAEVEVCVDREVTRFRVAVRPHTNGPSLAVTDTGSRRIEREVAKAGPGAYHEFDYGAEKNCVILAPDRVVPLAEFDVEAWERAEAAGV